MSRVARWDGGEDGAVTDAKAAELTIDELAASVQMTVRNVRAYAGRGLIPPPRLVGRTGYYGREHADRLRLVRGLLDRGYTLAAVERMLAGNEGVPAAHALDLLETLRDPLGDEQPESVTTAELAAMANVEHDPGFVDQLLELGLVERVGDEELLLLKPYVVRAGAQAIALGLGRESVVALMPFLSERLRQIAEQFVGEVRSQMWAPFADAGMPEDQWPEMLRTIEAILPVASQAVLAVFRNELHQAIDTAMGEELESLG
jgi:DNA-binding transcriptional MerR regulator